MFSDEFKRQAKAGERELEHQARLAREARENNYGTLTTGEPVVNVAKVEITIGEGDTWTSDYHEFSGHFIVRMPEDVDPYETATDAVEAEIERRWPDATYTSIDDINAV